MKGERSREGYGGEMFAIIVAGITVGPNRF